MSRLLSFLCLMLFASGALSTAPAAEQSQPAQQDILVDAASTDVDYRNQTLLFRDVRVKQGPVQIQADKAIATARGEGPDIENAEWTFSGNVHIVNEGGSMKAAEAQVNFRNSRIASATITGSPASFEQQLEDPAQLVRGQAGSIEYDVLAETVRLQNDAYLTDGRKDIRSQNLVYSIRDQRLLANAGEQGDERVHITINPSTLGNRDETERKPDAANPQQ